MAQQGIIIPTAASATFPGCALSCSTLLQAQDVCMPPNQPAGSQLQYDQCFCNSPFLTPFAVTSDSVCLTECTIAADRVLLQSWYNTFCSQVRLGIDPTTQTVSVATTSAPTAVATTITATSGTVTATTTSSSRPTGTSSPQKEQTWIEAHYQWIIAVCVIAVGLGLLAWLAVWLKRRHRRKLEKQRAVASGFNFDPEKRPSSDPHRSATPDLWGPHQMMQATKGYGYSTEEAMQELETKGRHSYRGAQTSRRVNPDAIEVAEVDKETIGPRPSNKRARPSELEVNARMIGAADRRSKNRGKNKGDNRPNDKEAEAGLPIPERQRSKLKSRRGDTDPEYT